MSEIENLRKAVEGLDAQCETVVERITKMREDFKSRFKDLLEKHQTAQIHDEFLDDFVKEPYVMIPKRGHEWYVIVPKWLKMQIGYLDHSTKSYNIFIVNKYMKWLSEIPSSLESKLKFPEPLPFRVFNGMLLTGEKLQEKGWEKYRRFLSRREGKDRLRIKPRYEFKLIAQMIEDGTLPFIPKPIADEDLRDWSGEGFAKYREICESKNIMKLQDKTWKEFIERGAMGVFWAFGSGKSLFGHRIIGGIKGEHLVIVPTLTLKEQWNERLAVFNPSCIGEVTVETYRSYEKVRNKVWNVVLFDECQHLPAPTFIRLSTIQTKYRIGFSGSPFREDGQENYIFALTGFPVGMAWEDLLRLRIVEAPLFRVYILRDRKAKDKKLAELLRLPLKTIVFCDSLDYGETISKQHEIPFVCGYTRERLEIIRSSEACVVSRVGDEGVSDPNLERVIEVAFLFGSRMQESQRFGRLMHSAKKTQHIILMTEKEFERYHKRLNAILQRGFKIEYIR